MTTEIEAPRTNFRSSSAAKSIANLLGRVGPVSVADCAKEFHVGPTTPSVTLPRNPVLTRPET